MLPHLSRALLDGASIEELAEENSIFWVRHGGLTLFCYNARSSPQVPLVAQCRGLVLETHTWKPVVWGLDRFRSWHEQQAPKDLVPPLRVEEKEDGTFVQLAMWNGEWMATTRHTFCATDVLYRNLLLEAGADASLTHFAQRVGLDPHITYCFEVCSSRNRVIRIYGETPTCFLLAGVNTTSREELSSNELDRIANHGGLRRPRVYHEATTFDEAVAVLHQRSCDEALFEGFVIMGAHGRLKIKNPFYREVHHLKFRGWIQASPKRMLKFVLRPSHLECLMQSMCDLRDDVNVFRQLAALFDAVLNEEIERLCAVVKAVAREDGDTSSDAERRRVFEAVTSDVELLTGNILCRSSVWDEVRGLSGGALRSHLRELFRENESFVFRHCFERRNAVLPWLVDSSNHGDGYCWNSLLAEGACIAQSPPSRREDGSWQVQCACGQPMELKRFKYDRLRLRKCVCGSPMLAVDSYDCGTLLWVCTDGECDCTHEAHQTSERGEVGQPLGIPANNAARRMRQACHWWLSELRKRNGWSKAEGYAWLEKLMDIPTELHAHMSIMGPEKLAQLLGRLKEELFH